MQALSFYLIYPFLWVLARMPLSVLYFISDYVLYPLLYKILGYRTKVVKDNLKQVFVDKTDAERLDIERKFYHYLCDLFMETIKGFGITEKELNERITWENTEVLKEVYESTNGVILSLGHVGNYEWLAQNFPSFFGYKLAVPYRKLNNPYFDKLFKVSREKGGAALFHTNKTREFIVKNRADKYAMALANDQSAPAESSYWVKFLNRDTSFFVGTEKLAKQLNFGVVFLYIRIAERGKYTATFHKITATPKDEPAGSIMEQHAKLVEKNILEAPEYWLWSHRRWKHKKPAGFGYGFVRG